LQGFNDRVRNSFTGGADRPESPAFGLRPMRLCAAARDAGSSLSIFFGESRVDFSSDRGVEPPLDRRAGHQAEPRPDAPAPTPAPPRIEWPIARGRINDPI
jgi:hypothetical protein